MRVSGQTLSTMGRARTRGLERQRGAPMRLAPDLLSIVTANFLIRDILLRFSRFAWTMLRSSLGLLSAYLALIAGV